MEHDGDLVGDFAVWIDPTDELAMIGYTIAPEHQGHVYATEAAEAVIDWLFARGTIHRVAATIDPRNMASARVLERCGFEYVGTARSAAGSAANGRTTPVSRSSRSIGATGRLGRPTRRPTCRSWRSTQRTCGRCRRSTSPTASDDSSEASVESIAEAAHPPEIDGDAVTPWYRAIVADGEIAGFIMLGLRQHRPPRLWQLLVDQRHQRRGIATRAVGDVARHLRSLGETELEASFVDEPGGPEIFYRRLGFVRTGDAPAGGEIRSRVALATVIDGLTTSVRSR